MYNPIYLKFKEITHKARKAADYRTAALYYATAITYFENNNKLPITEDQQKEIWNLYFKLIEIYFVRYQEDFYLAVKYAKRFWSRYKKTEDGVCSGRILVWGMISLLKHVITELPANLQSDLKKLELEVKNLTISEN